MPGRRTADIDFTGLFAQGFTNAVQNPTIHNYKPHPKQIMFHKSTAKVKQLIGGNRSGKSEGGVAEDIFWMRGEHPYRRVPPPPTRGRIIATSYTEGHEEIIIPKLTRWLPPSSLKNGSWEDSYEKGKRKLTLENGSTCSLMSYEQDLKKFAGTSQHWIHFDEEPPEDIYKENRMRLIDTGGSSWMTMTPVDGMTWTYDTIHLPGLKGEKDYCIVIVDTTDNPYLSPEEVEEVLGDLSEDERKIRKEGKYVPLGGIVFKMFNPEIHVIPPIDPASVLGWTIGRSMDHGLNNPTCWLWHAISKDGLIITFDEIYQNETLIAEFAQMIKEREKQPGRRPADITIGDPSIAQRNAQTGMSVQSAYAMEEIFIGLGSNDVPVGIERMQAYLKYGKWLITENCTHLIHEITRLRWKVYATAKQRAENNARPEIHKYKDHAPDSARYYFGLMPDLRLPVEKNDTKERVNRAVQNALGAVTSPVGKVFDWNYRATQTQWTPVDEHLGNEW